MASTPKDLVYVVDDDEDTLLLAEEILKEEGLQVETFANSRTAFKQLTIKSPDIVVLDLMMPDLDGFEFCRLMRQQPATMNTPVLVTTSLDDGDSIRQAYAVGATNFAVKPINWVVEVHRLFYMLRAAEAVAKLRQDEHKTRKAIEEWRQTFNSVADMATILDITAKELHRLGKEGNVKGAERVIENLQRRLAQQDNESR